MSPDGVFKENIKEALLQSLADKSTVVRNQISNLIATIAAIEIPRGEWGTLITSLCTNANHEQMPVRLASLTTIGYICEEIRPEDLSTEIKNLIMQAVTQNISKEPADEEPCQISMKALLNSVPYMANNFQNQDERDFIMAKVLD